MAKAAKKTTTRKCKPNPNPAFSTIEAKRAEACFDMEPHVSDLVSMGRIAMSQFDKDQGLFIFAVSRLEDMLIEFKAHYLAVEFPI